MSAKSNHNVIAEEQHLLSEAQKGDKTAFGLIVETYHRLVVSVAFRICGDVQIAEDVAQDTFMKAWQQLPNFQPERSTSFRAWLCRIAHNRSIDLLRQNRPETELDPRLPAQITRPDRQVERDETATEVQAAILRLPETSRTALILREYEGLSYAEIADTLEIPIGTVMSRLYNARKRLTKELTPLLLDLER
ncbi:MAG: sigma-70 family RNA polymerase sigma factor [Chloroflexi bacterium]|nr:sigma-70 family RNA polymerase sigma factor [Chloroflexota bacterium]